MTHDTAALLAALVKADRVADKATAARKDAAAAYMAALAADGVTTLTVAIGANVHTGTVVAGSRASFDAAAARETLSPAMFRKVTRTVVDADAVKACVTLGTLDDATVDTFRTVKPTAPYVRLS